MDGITDYELIDGWHIKNANFGYNGGQSSIMMLFRKKSDGKYYTREVSIKFTVSTAGIDISEVYAEVYRELPDFGPDSKICVIRVDGYGDVMYAPQGYIYYTAASNPCKVLSKPRTSKDAPVEFHTFDSEVIAIDHETYTRTSGYMAFALGDGTVMIYTTRRSGLTPTTNLDTFEDGTLSFPHSMSKAKSVGWDANTEVSPAINRAPRHTRQPLPKRSGCFYFRPAAGR